MRSGDDRQVCHRLLQRLALARRAIIGICFPPIPWPMTVISPPMILQSDNGSEFHGAAMNDRQWRVYGKLVRLTDDEIDEIITEIKQLWPECLMVRGSPRHSQSNGGIERVNRTMQDKLGAWMTDTSSRRWSGCFFNEKESS